MLYPAAKLDAAGRFDQLDETSLQLFDTLAGGEW